MRGKQSLPLRHFFPLFLSLSFADTPVCPKQDLSCLAEQGKPQGFCEGDRGVLLSVCVFQCVCTCVCVYAQLKFDLCGRRTTWSSVCTSVWRQRRRVRDGPPSHSPDSQRPPHIQRYTHIHSHLGPLSPFHTNQMRQGLSHGDQNN